MDERLVAAIRHLVDDLARGRFSELETDGRAGEMTAAEIETAIREYGRTLTPLPDEGIGLIGSFPARFDPRLIALDVPLWTLEEGRSDLTLLLEATKDGDAYHLVIESIHVL